MENPITVVAVLFEEKEKVNIVIKNIEKDNFLQEMYNNIGNDCRLIEPVYIQNNLTIWIDEEGMLKDNKNGIVIKANDSNNYTEDVYLLGNVVISADSIFNPENGREARSLTDGEIETIKEMFASNEISFIKRKE